MDRGLPAPPTSTKPNPASYRSSTGAPLGSNRVRERATWARKHGRRLPSRESIWRNGAKGGARTAPIGVPVRPVRCPRRAPAVSCPPQPRTQAGTGRRRELLFPWQRCVLELQLGPPEGTVETRPPRTCRDGLHLAEPPSRGDSTSHLWHAQPPDGAGPRMLRVTRGAPGRLSWRRSAPLRLPGPRHRRR